MCVKYINRNAVYISRFVYINDASFYNAFLGNLGKVIHCN